jgi:hypothetical protein
MMRSQTGTIQPMFQIIQQGSYKAVNGQIIYVYNETSNTRCTLDKSINRSGMAQKPTNNKDIYYNQ